MTNLVRPRALIHQAVVSAAGNKVIAAWATPILISPRQSSHVTSPFCSRHWKATQTSFNSPPKRFHTTMATQSASSQSSFRPDLAGLFTDLEQSLSTTNLGPSRWYLIVLAALVGLSVPLRILLIPASTSPAPARSPRKASIYSRRLQALRSHPLDLQGRASRRQGLHLHPQGLERGCCKPRARGRLA
jgi:hypothetical protein